MQINHNDWVITEDGRACFMVCTKEHGLFSSPHTHHTWDVYGQAEGYKASAAKKIPSPMAMVDLLREIRKRAKERKDDFSAAVYQAVDGVLHASTKLDSCEHDWVDVTSERVRGLALCLRCHSVAPLETVEVRS